MKSTTYICDRCGKEKTKHTNRNLILSNHEVIRDVGWITLNSRSKYKRTLDLCEDCMGEFANWFNVIQPMPD